MELLKLRVNDTDNASAEYAESMETGIVGLVDALEDVAGEVTTTEVAAVVGPKVAADRYCLIMWMSLIRHEASMMMNGMLYDLMVAEIMYRLNVNPFMVVEDMLRDRGGHDQNR